MKTLRQNLLILAGLISCLCAFGLHAADLMWDADPNTANPQDGAGTWDATTNTWWDGANNVAWDNVTPANAIFGTNSGTAGAVAVAAGLTINVGNLTFNPSSLGNYSLTPGDAASRLNFSSSSVVNVASGLTVTNTVIFSGTSSFTKSGAGTFWIRPANPNLNSGITIVNQGTLVLGSSSGRYVLLGDLIVTNSGDVRLGAANTIYNAATTSVATGATFEMNGNGLAISNFVLNGGTVIQTSTEALAVTGGVDARSGAINQNGGTGKLDAGTVTKSTPGTVTLTTRGSSAASGGITNLIVNDGTLVLDYVQNSSKLHDTAGAIVMNGGVLIFTNGTHTETLNAVTLAGGVMTNSSGTSKLSLAGNYDVRAGSAYTVLSGAASLTKTTAATATLATAETYSGGTLISLGTLQLGDGNTSGTLSGNITNNAAMLLNPGAAGAAFGNLISGSGSVTKIGGGSVSLTGANAYQGATTISNGSLTISGSSTLGDGTGTLNLSGGTLSSTASRTPSSAPVGNPVNVTADSAITTTSTGATVDFSLTNNSIAGTGGTLTFSNAAATAAGIFQPRFSGSGFNFTRPVIIANGSFGTTRLDSFNTTGTTQTFSAAISGTGGYRRTASVSGTGGTTILAGNNSYSGLTEVNQGILIVNGTLGTNSVTVAASGTLGGNGIIAGPVTVAGTLSPGGSIGILTISNALTLQAGSTNFFELNKTLATNDLVRGLSTVTYAGTLVVNNLSGTLAANDSFKIFSAGNYLGTFSATNFPALNPGLTWDLSSLASNGTIKVVSSVTTPPTLNVAQAGGNLTFTWSDASFKLQSQTNSLNAGVKTNWSDYPGGGSSPVNVTINPANPTVFFRLSQ